MSTVISQFEQLTGQFLIAMPDMEGPYFSRSVVLICSHGAEGSLGLVINHPSPYSLGEILKQFDREATNDQAYKQTIFTGGPVQEEHGFILHTKIRQRYDTTISINQNLFMSSSRELLFLIGEGKGPENSLIGLGFSGWGPGQLEQEVLHNHWLTAPGKPQLIFETPVSERWIAAGRLAGVDLNTISPHSGHA